MVCKFHKNRTSGLASTGSLKSQKIGFICIGYYLEKLRSTTLYAIYVERVTDRVAFRFVRHKHSVKSF